MAVYAYALSPSMFHALNSISYTAHTVPGHPLLYGRSGAYSVEEQRYSPYTPRACMLNINALVIFCVPLDTQEIISVYDTLLQVSM